MADTHPLLPRGAWVVVPMYNEAEVIGSTLATLLPVFPHVVCVDDASRDDSAQLARRAGAHVVRHPLNFGQGAALQTGIEYALRDPRARAVVTFDADGQHRVEDAAAMLGKLGTPGVSGAPTEVVLGSRFLDDRTQMPRSKRAVLKVATAYTRLSVHLKVTDTHNGLRVLSRTAAQRIHLTQNGMAHATEILEQIAKAHLEYLEYPVEIRYTDYSKAKGQSLLNSVNILVDLMLR